jgi:hypothetical protein
MCNYTKKNIILRLSEILCSAGVSVRGFALTERRNRTRGLTDVG